MDGTAQAIVPAPGALATARRPRRAYARHYMGFVLPAGIVIVAVIVFPWVFTLFMSAHAWKLGGAREFIGLANYERLFTDSRFALAMLRTLYFTALTVIAPLVLGTFAAVVFNRRFPLRGLARTIFILPMMATPVAVALVWTMMFHPQLGVLNYILTSFGLPPSLWVYDPATVLPTLALVETWHWTPLVMLIVLGGIASLPTEPFEAARIDGAGHWATFRHVTLPLIWPFLAVALIIRTIDALKAFDIIYVITQGGPGTASETINLFLYLQAFAFYDVGYASAIVVVFFALVLVLSASLLWVRQRSKWTG